MKVITLSANMIHLKENKVGRDVREYLMAGAPHLATFPLVAGLQWTGREGGGEHEGIERMMHPLLLQMLNLDFPAGCDMIMIPQGDDETLTNLLTFFYTGRWVRSP